MAIQVEIWQQDIIEGLWSDNQFLNAAVNEDQYVLAGKVVHIPNAGGPPAVTKNRTSLPATVTKRTDVDVTYPLDEFTSDPVLIPDAESVELSYDKRNSVLSETKMAQYENVAASVLVNWAPDTAIQIIRTTGAAVAAHTPSATGNRKAFVLADLKTAQKVLNTQNYPQADRYALLDADMYDQFTASLTATQQTDFSRAYDEKAGVLGKLFGFNIMMRSSVLVFDNAATPVVKAVGAAGAAADNAAVLCWHKSAVGRAMGDVKFSENTGDPTYYGDIYSSLIRMGGRKRRLDKKGVIAIVQAATA